MAIHWKVYPNTAPRGGVTQEEVDKAVEVNKASTRLVSRNALGTNRFGDMPRERMEDFQRYLSKLAGAAERNRRLQLLHRGLSNPRNQCVRFRRHRGNGKIIRGKIVGPKKGHS